jgi:hypothetical protein
MGDEEKRLQKGSSKSEIWALALALVARKKVEENAGQLSGLAHLSLDAGRVGSEHRTLPLSVPCDDSHPCAQPDICMPHLQAATGSTPSDASNTARHESKVILSAIDPAIPHELVQKME